MSFFNTFRGFGRSSKKNKHIASANYRYENSSASSLHRSQSQPPEQQQDQQQQQQQPSHTNQKPLFLCQPFVRTSLVKGSYQTIVVLPKYVDPNEWVALNVFEFFTYINQFYGVISEFENCPTMNAGPGIDYTWVDSNRQEVRLPASTFMDYVLTWISNKLDDQTLFPTKQGVPFPAHFMTVVRKMYQQMFRIFAHIYHNHFDKIIHLSLEAHWNSFFAHFISFARQFDLLDKRELLPMEPLIEALEHQGKIH